MKYRKKPVVIEAIQWVGDNFIEIDQFITSYHETYPQAGKVVIATLEGDVVASMGDWIIQGVNGEFYPCKPNIFAKTYELADTTPDLLALLKRCKPWLVEATRVRMLTEQSTTELDALLSDIAEMEADHA